MASFLLLLLSLSLLGGSSDGARASHHPPHRAANVGRHLLGDCSQTPTCTVLPAIWSRHLDANSGCDYYYNAVTLESTWDSPPCPPPRPDADPPLSPSTPAATMFRTSGPGVLSTEVAALATTSAAPTTTRATPAPSTTSPASTSTAETAALATTSAVPITTSPTPQPSTTSPASSSTTPRNTETTSEPMVTPTPLPPTRRHPFVMAVVQLHGVNFHKFRRNPRDQEAVIVAVRQSLSAASVDASICDGSIQLLGFCTQQTVTCQRAPENATFHSRAGNVTLSTLGQSESASVLADTVTASGILEREAARMQVRAKLLERDRFEVTQVFIRIDVRGVHYQFEARSSESVPGASNHDIDNDHPSSSSGNGEAEGALDWGTTWTHGVDVRVLEEEWAASLHRLNGTEFNAAFTAAVLDQGVPVELARFLQPPRLCLIPIAQTGHGAGDSAEAGGPKPAETGKQENALSGCSVAEIVEMLREREFLLVMAWGEFPSLNLLGDSFFVGTVVLAVLTASFVLRCIIKCQQSRVRRRRGGRGASGGRARRANLAPFSDDL